VVAVAVETFSIGNRLVNELSRESFHTMTRITQVGRFSVQELRVLALVCRMTATAHADLERAMLFLAHELFVHVAFETEPGHGLGQKGLGFRVVRPVARGTPPARYRFVAVLTAGERFFVMAFVAEIRLFHLQELFCFGLVRCVTGQAAALRDRFMRHSVRKHGLVVTRVAKSRRFRNEQVFKVLRMRIMACGAVSGNDRLVLHRPPVSDACPVMTFEAELRHIERQQFFVVVGTMGIMAEAAERRRGREMDVLLCRDVLVVAFEA
jgi:hypothetical protein